MGMRHLIAIVLASAPSAQPVPVLYVDPVAGVDVVGGGAPNAPLKTMTFATAQAVGPTVFRLRAGRYETASGETFPINLPAVCIVEADPATVPAGSGLVTFATTLGTTSTLLVSTPLSVTIGLRELNFTGGMFRAVQLNTQQGTTAQLLLSRCTIAQSRCVVVNAVAQSTVNVQLLGCRCSGPDTPIILAAAAGSAIDATLEQSLVLGGLAAGILLDASGGGSVRLALRASRVGDAQLRALHALTDLGGSVTTDIEHCLIHDVGTRSTGAAVGAIVDRIGAGGGTPRHRVVNSILHGNRADAPLGATAAYTWGANFVSQTSLAGVGGNVVATATFVNETGNDFHLAPTSSARDAGRASDRTVFGDLDGDPYLDAMPDLGPDEVHFCYVEAAAIARLGAPFVLRPLIAPQAPFGLLLAGATFPGSFGPGLLHLSGTVVDAGLYGTCNTQGVGQLELLVPANPWLHGRAVFWQAVTLAPPLLGANALRTLLLQ
jgi:hypothetical protein